MATDFDILTQTRDALCAYLDALSVAQIDTIISTLETSFRTSYLSGLQRLKISDKELYIVSQLDMLYDNISKCFIYNHLPS